MRVYNLTERDVDFHNLLIPMNGGYRDYDGLEYESLPDRDRKLEDAGILAFHDLPDGWTPKVAEPEPVPAAPPAPAATGPVATAVKKDTRKDYEAPAVVEEKFMMEEKVEEKKDESSFSNKRNRNR